MLYMYIHVHVRCIFLVAVQGGVLHTPSLPVLRVDPEGRCAAMLLYGAHLAILPFKHADSVLEEHDPDVPLIAR